MPAPLGRATPTLPPNVGDREAPALVGGGAVVVPHLRAGVSGELGVVVAVPTPGEGPRGAIPPVLVGVDDVVNP
jgi:hypothetical protein